MEKNLIKAENEHDSAKEEHDNLQKMLLDLQAGIEHLCGKLNEIKLEVPGNQVINIENVT